MSPIATAAPKRKSPAPPAEHAELKRPKYAAMDVGIGRNGLYQLFARDDAPKGLTSKISPRCRLVHMPTLKAWISALGEVA